MRLPNPEKATIDLTKLRDYCLNALHPRGRHKARVFATKLGMAAPHAEALRDQLLLAARTNELASLGEKDGFGQRYVLDFELTGPTTSKGMVRSIWIVRTNEDFPRLTTCYLL